jgi:hypothetical protein
MAIQSAHPVATKRGFLILTAAGVALMALLTSASALLFPGLLTNERLASAGILASCVGLVSYFAALGIMRAVSAKLLIERFTINDAAAAMLLAVAGAVFAGWLLENWAFAVVGGFSGMGPRPCTRGAATAPTARR